MLSKQSSPLLPQEQIQITRFPIRSFFLETFPEFGPMSLEIISDNAKSSKPDGRSDLAHLDVRRGKGRLNEDFGILSSLRYRPVGQRTKKYVPAASPCYSMLPESTKTRNVTLFAPPAESTRRTNTTGKEQKSRKVFFHDDRWLEKAEQQSQGRSYVPPSLPTRMATTAAASGAGRFASHTTSMRRHSAPSISPMKMPQRVVSPFQDDAKRCSKTLMVTVPGRRNSTPY